ncbi:hypothetical protein PP742_gp32 [Alcaligenes phage vB_Af_QDWS595]|uniref:Uncharacterized protein n=1 Tax=Alcaligenes phage vB_Af_QDWS595 TaxID=2877946 RepID=A0AAE8Y1E9_9CAUD|nr:hypothetical protein PP742_gp32 [Alcaligenes phage vB_Af_QDWS595]UCR75516.1 hypothetical protein vBAfaPQDWS595_32 [Alcaligenes phage vB_Af_QDWS595]
MKEKTIKFLVAGTVSFLLDDSKEVKSSDVNTILSVKDHRVTAYDIGRAQQQLQMQLDQEIGKDSVITPVRVVITGLFLLGEMTHEEFSFRPTEPKTDVPAN